MFKPIKLLRWPSLQTVLPTFWPLPKAPVDYWLDVVLSDGDVLRNGINIPSPEIQQMKGIILSIHGLTGCSDSNYNRRLNSKIITQGYIFCRMNLRGCGPGKGLAKKTYHAGQIDDLHELILKLASQFPNQPIFLMGFSLGANLMLRYLGMKKQEIPDAVKSFMAVSPPFDLTASSEHLKKDHHYWDRYFVRRLISSVYELHEKYPELGQVRFPSQCSLADFDDIYTAPRHGFGTVEKYYSTCSCGHYLHDITIPGHIIGAYDDPIVSYKDIPHVPQHIALHLSRYGGHCGFIGENLGKKFFWLDDFILTWLERNGPFVGN